MTDNAIRRSESPISPIRISATGRFIKLRSGEGRNQRAVDIERAYAAAIDDILTRDVDLVIHAGDVFHHTRPSWQAMRISSARCGGSRRPAFRRSSSPGTTTRRACGRPARSSPCWIWRCRSITFVADYDMEDVDVFPTSGCSSRQFRTAR